MNIALKAPNPARTLRSAEPSSFQNFSFQRFSFTQTPLFPALRFGQRLIQEPPAKSKFLAVVKVWLICIFIQMDIVSAESVVNVTADGILGGAGGKITIKQCPNWAPNPDDFTTAPRLEENSTLQGSSDRNTPRKFYFSQIAAPQEVTETPIDLVVSGQIEIHCRYGIRARIIGDFSAGPVSVTIFAGTPYLLSADEIIPLHLDRGWIETHWLEATLTPTESSGQRAGGALTFITNDCGWMPGCNLEADGGDAISGNGGTGGEILFQSPHGTQIWLSTRGGNGGDGSVSQPAGGDGGEGGRIAFSSRAGYLSLVNADAGGGTGGFAALRSSKPGNGGRGGQISVADLRYGIHGKLLARGGAGGIPMGPWNPQDAAAPTGPGGDGGRGGLIHLALKPEEDAAFEFGGDQGGLDVSGGEATSGWSVGGLGGDGGQVTIESSWSTVVHDTTVRAYGGKGGYGRGRYLGPSEQTPAVGLTGVNGGNGGNAGILEFSAGISFSASVADLNGGSGGEGGTGGTGSSQGGTGGEGGDGGRNGLLKMISPENQSEFGSGGLPGRGGVGGDGIAGGNGGRGGDSASSSRAPGEGGIAGIYRDLPGSQGPNGGTITVPPPQSRPLPTPDFSDQRCQTPPIIIVPGIAGSVLRDRGDGMNILWPSFLPSVISQDAIRRLSTIPGDGAADVIASDIMRAADNSDWLPLGIKPIYQPLIDYFTALGYDEYLLEDDPSRITGNYMLEPGRFRNKPTLFIFPYDWRKSATLSADRLAAYIENISRLHGDAKVRIVAHSMGGLVMRQLMVSEPDLVRDRVAGAVTIASPLLGAPKAIYSMLYGDFFEMPIDYYKNDDIKYVLPTFDGACELLPSQAFFDLTGNGVPVFAESGQDLDGKPGVDTPLGIPEIGSHFRKTIGANYPVAVRPYEVNSRLHTPSFDNWSGDTTGLPILHLAGVRNEPDTIVGVRARGRNDASFSAAETTSFYSYSTVRGRGDKTVPLLSEARDSSYLAPKAIMRVLVGVDDFSNRMTHGGGDDLEHSAMVGNPRILEWTSHFLGNVAEVASYERFPGIPPGTIGSRVSITVVGRSYVETSTEQNSLGVEISHYEGSNPGTGLGEGGSLPCMVVSGSTDETVTLSGSIRVPMLVSMLRWGTTWTPPALTEPPGGFPEAVGIAEAIAIWPQISNYNQNQIARDYQATKLDGRVSVFVDRSDSEGKLLETYKCSFAIPRTGSIAHDSGEFHWEMIIAPGSAPLGWIDWNRDSEVDYEELVFPDLSLQSATGLIVSRPEITLQLTGAAGANRVQLSGGNPSGGNVRLFMSLDGGKFVEYTPGSHPDLLLGSHRLVRAFAIDDTGNSSATMEFTLDPIASLGIGKTGPGEVRLAWSAAGLPVVLESAPSPAGPWTTYTGVVDSTSSERQATIQVGSERRQFFRLRLVE